VKGGGQGGGAGNREEIKDERKLGEE